MSRWFFAALAAIALCALTGCGGAHSAHSPGASRHLSPAIAPPQIPVGAIKIPPESARTPEGATPGPVPKALSLAPGEKTIDDVGLHLIESFEGYSRCAYWDPYGRVWTAGYGQTRGITGGFCFSSQLAAQNNLAGSVRGEYEWAVHGLGPKVNRDQNAVDGLDSFAYNLGAGIFTGALRSLLVAGDFNAACRIMESYDHAGGVVLPGLRTRRLEECAVIKRPAPKPASTKDLLARRRTLRRVLLTYGCIRRREANRVNPEVIRVGPRCARWFRKGASVNKQLHARGIR